MELISGGEEKINKRKLFILELVLRATKKIYQLMDKLESRIIVCHIKLFLPQQRSEQVIRANVAYRLVFRDGGLMMITKLSIDRLFDQIKVYYSKIIYKMLSKYKTFGLALRSA